VTDGTDRDRGRRGDCEWRRHARRGYSSATVTISVEHQQRALALADRLRAGGIDAEIDQYNAAPPEGWPLWCERQIEAADFVLMLCTESYHRRVGGDEASGQGLGVVWEAGRGAAAGVAKPERALDRRQGLGLIADETTEGRPLARLLVER
jgi:hypothetical protein